MGLFDKFKNIFTEEVEESEVKKEVRQVEIVAPKELEEVKVEEKEEVKKEPEKDEKFVFPVYFDDKDFEELVPKKEEVKKEIPKREAYGVKVKEPKEVKKFTPSPIISPVYGVLDKNYNSDDIVNKNSPSRSDYRKVNRSVTLDEVRKKAYGTLEDELENSLFNDDPIYMEKEIPEVTNTNTKTEELFDKIDEVEPVERLENKIIEEYKPNKEEIEDNMTLAALNSLDEEDLDMTSSDLFNLIDSMYEKDDEDGNV